MLVTKFNEFRPVVFNKVLLAQQGTQRIKIKGACTYIAQVEQITTEAAGNFTPVGRIEGIFGLHISVE